MEIKCLLKQIIDRLLALANYRVRVCVCVCVCGHVIRNIELDADEVADNMA